MLNDDKSKNKIFVNISAIKLKELKKKYPAVNIDKIIKDKVKYFRKHPFQKRELHLWIDKIKESITLVNESYEEEKDSTTKLSEKEIKELLKSNYKKIIDILKYWMDVEEDDYSLIALWIIGTYFHKDFSTYPYLFFNAMKGSGKSRILRLIKILSKDGRMLNSITEAVLFRTKGTLCIDEFEAIGRKGNENLRELLNSAYKKGTNVIRYKKGERDEQVEEEFEVYRPIVIANIWGMEEVLSDRCINIILERSNKPNIVKKVENFEQNSQIMGVLESFSRVNGSVGSFKSLFEKVQNNWNKYLDNYNKHNIPKTPNTPKAPKTPNTPISINNNNINNKINKTDLSGRDLELFLPLFLIADVCGVLDNFLKIAVKITRVRKEKDVYESKDIQLYDFISQFEDTNYIKVSQLTSKFKEFLGSEEKDKWPNTWWMGLALKRLKLIKEKKKSSGMMVVLDIEKAQEKIKIFKDVEKEKPENKQEELDIEIQKI